MTMNYQWSTYMLENPELYAQLKMGASPPPPLPPNDVDINGLLVNNHTIYQRRTDIQDPPTDNIQPLQISYHQQYNVSPPRSAPIHNNGSKVLNVSNNISSSKTPRCFVQHKSITKPLATPPTPPPPNKPLTGSSKSLNSDPILKLGNTSLQSTSNTSAICAITPQSANLNHNNSAHSASNHSTVSNHTNTTVISASNHSSHSHHSTHSNHTPVVINNNNNNVAQPVNTKAQSSVVTIKPKNNNALNAQIASSVVKAATSSNSAAVQVLNLNNPLPPIHNGNNNQQSSSGVGVGSGSGSGVADIVIPMDSNNYNALLQQMGMTGINPMQYNNYNQYNNQYGNSYSNQYPQQTAPVNGLNNIHDIYSHPYDQHPSQRLYNTPPLPNNGYYNNNTNNNYYNQSHSANPRFNNHQNPMQQQQAPKSASDIYNQPSFNSTYPYNNTGVNNQYPYHNNNQRTTHNQYDNSNHNAYNNRIYNPPHMNMGMNMNMNMNMNQQPIQSANGNNNNYRQSIQQQYDLYSNIHQNNNMIPIPNNNNNNNNNSMSNGTRSQSHSPRNHPNTVTITSNKPRHTVTVTTNNINNNNSNKNGVKTNNPAADDIVISHEPDFLHRSDGTIISPNADPTQFGTHLKPINTNNDDELDAFTAGDDALFGDIMVTLINVNWNKNIPYSTVRFHTSNRIHHVPLMDLTNIGNKTNLLKRQNKNKLNNNNNNNNNQSRFRIGMNNKLGHNTQEGNNNNILTPKAVDNNNNDIGTTVIRRNPKLSDETLMKLPHLRKHRDYIRTIDVNMGPKDYNSYRVSVNSKNNASDDDDRNGNNNNNNNSNNNNNNNNNNNIRNNNHSHSNRNNLRTQSLLSTNIGNLNANNKNKKNKRMSACEKGDLFKTELCENWVKKGHCTYGKKCHFAHGREDIRTRWRIENYKTQPCCDPARADSRLCLFGKRCNYAHPGEQLRRSHHCLYLDEEYQAEIIRDYGPNTPYPFGIYI